MSEDEAERQHFWTSNPVPDAFEPVTRWRVDGTIPAEDCGGAAAPDVCWFWLPATNLICPSRNPNMSE